MNRTQGGHARNMVSAKPTSIEGTQPDRHVYRLRIPYEDCCGTVTHCVPVPRHTEMDRLRRTDDRHVLVMVGLGDWQLHRYHERHGINVRIAQAKATAPVPLTTVIGVDHPLPADRRVGPGHRLRHVRGRPTRSSPATVPATTASASRSSHRWCSPTAPPCWSTGAGSRPAPAARSRHPTLPPVPTGIVTVTGRVHLPESEAGHADAARRIARGPADRPGDGRRRSRLSRTSTRTTCCSTSNRRKRPATSRGSRPTRSRPG